MKGKKKYIVPLLLAGVTATGVVATNVQQQVQVQAVESSTITNIEGAELRFSPFQEDSYAVGDKVYLPVPNVVGLETGEKVVYKVKKGNKTVSIKNDNDGKGDYFVAQYEGYYNISLEVVLDGKVTSRINNLSVWVEKEDAVINLPVNSEYVIPAKIPAKQAGFKIPAPSVTLTENGEDVEKKLTDATNPLTTDNLKVWLITPETENNEKDLTEYLDSSKTFYAVPDTMLTETGTYQIVYEYVIPGVSGAADTVISRLESNFQVVSDYDTSKIKLAVTFLDDMPSTGNVNTDISIPKVKITDVNSNSTDAVNGYVQVVVTNLDDPNDKVAVNYDDFTFRPTKQGHYTVSYVASIPLFGDKIKTSTITPGDIIEVKDKQAPTLIPTYKYEFNTEGEISKVYVDGVAKDIVATSEATAREEAEKLLVNRKVDIPSIGILKEVTKDGKTTKEAKVTIPAAYATDNFYTYAGTLNDDIVITRTWRTATGVVHKVTEDPNLPAEISFPTKGNGEIRYKAQDKAGNTLGEIVYDIVIYDGTDTEVIEDMKEGKTKFNLNVGTTVVSDGEETLTFAKPTATDTYDKNVEVKTFIKINGEEKNVEDVKYITLNDDGEYEINIDKMIKSTATAFNSFDIYAKAYVDNILINTRGDDALKNQLVDTNVVTSDITTVELIKASNDTGAPQFKMAGAMSWNEALFDINQTKIAHDDGASIGVDGYLLDSSSQKIKIAGTTVDYAPFDQGDEIKIPAIKFSEDYDANLTVSLSVTDQFGNDVSVKQGQVRPVPTSPGYDYYMENASFKLSTYGVYTVTFTAQDIFGHITVKSFGIRVNDKTAPTITIDDEDKFGKEIEVGEYFKVPAARLVKNGETIGGTITWDIYKVSDGAKYTEQPNGFTPLTEGTFFIRYEAVDEFGQKAELEDSMFTITAKDSVAPTINIDNTYRMQKVIKWDPEENDDFMVIDIPVAFATDKLTKKDIEVVYTVTGPNSSKPTVSDYDEEDKGYIKYFKASAQGVYTVKYSAIDDAGNERTETITIEVGDCQKPELIWNNQDEDLPTEVKLNETYLLDLNSMIKLTDNETSEAELLEKVSISMTAPDGTTVNTEVKNGDEYEWKFTQSGDYVLKFTVKDSVGNKKDYSYTINVPAEEAEENKVSPVLGTVLVVLSVVVLAGVVIYFVASSKKKGTKKSTKKSK